MPHLKAYHRPASIEETLRLLSRPGINTVMISGGTYLTARLADTVDEVVDLQALGLTEIQDNGDRLTLGALVRLQTLVDEAQAPPLLRETAHREGPNTLRHAATIGGLVVGADRESELLAALLVFEAEVHLQTQQGAKRLPLADFWLDRSGALAGGIVTAISLVTTGQTATARVARTPADRPIVAAVVRLSPQGRLHLALCGIAATPILVDPDSVKASLNPPGDFRGSREYRRQMAATLAKRVIGEVTNQAV